MNNLNDIKKDIHTINPDFSDKLIDLLYEYITQRFSNQFKSNIKGGI